jgi:hypothetical protein
MRVFPKRARRLMQFAKYAQRKLLQQVDVGSGESEVEDLVVVNNEVILPQEIATPYVRPPDDMMTFGQYKALGRNMSWVLKNDVPYTRWCIDTAAKHGKRGNFSCAG